MMDKQLLKVMIVVGILGSGLLNSIAGVIPSNAIWVDGSSKSIGSGTQKNPYKTLKAALNKLSNGDTIVVKTGIYRESMRISLGNSSKQTTIMAAPGERVQISGARKISGWEPVSKGIYKAVINWKPVKLFIDMQEQPLSRYPKSGWIKSTTAKDALIVAPELKTIKYDLLNGEIYIWTQVGNVYTTQTVLDLNKTKGECKISPFKSTWMRLKDGDKFYFKNHPELINNSGEWAVVAKGGQYELYFKPQNKADLDVVDALWSPRAVIEVYNADNIRISGLDVIKSATDGIAVNKSKNIQIDNCRILHNYRNGISMRDVENSAVKNNLVLHTINVGIAVTYSKNIVVEENEIAYGGMDGLVVGWKSQNVIINRNYIHHHYLWGHPDGFQMYKDVKNIKVVDNLLLMNGQGVMLSEADGMEFNGNMMVGCIANMLIFGHKNANNAKVISNTIAYPGYSCAAFTGSNYTVDNNVMVLGQRGSFFGTKKVKNFQSARNLYWGASGQAGTIYSDNGWHRSFAEYVKANPNQEKNSIYADPSFINAPDFYKVLDAKKLTKSSVDKLFLRPNTVGFATGDYIEINFDRIIRQVTDIGSDYICIKPALKESPLKSYSIANWKANKNFKLDLRLKADSPGSKLNSGKPAGSTIDIQAYMRGDFNNDGQRDIPAL